MLRRAVFPLGIWLCVYPAVTGLLMALRATGLNLSLPLQTMVVTALLVPTMIFILVPLVRKLTGTNLNV